MYSVKNNVGPGRDAMERNPNQIIPQIASWRGSLGLTLLAVVVGALLGIGTAFAGTFLEANGPTIGPLAFNGNGALIVPFCAVPLLLALGIVVLALRRAWLAMALYVVAFVAGYLPFSGIGLFAAA
jgi:hypothetical protein